MKLQEILNCRNKILLGDNLSILKQIENDTFDLITIKMVLHHVKNYDFTLNEITRILKKDGLLKRPELV